MLLGPIPGFLLQRFYLLLLNSEGLTMDQILRCDDTGLECNFVICGRTKDELLKKAGDHIRDFHRKEFSKDLYEKARIAIHEADCEQEIQIDRILLF